MAYTADDLARVRQAIVDLASGQRVTSVTHNGRTVQYASADINKLRALEREIVTALQSDAQRTRTRTRHVTTTKGL